MRLLFVSGNHCDMNMCLYKQKNPPNGGFFLICCVNSQSFTSSCATTIQNIATTCGCHACAKTVCTNATCLGWLICTFCCHDYNPCFNFLLFVPRCSISIMNQLGKIRLCVYLITRNNKTQHFYLVFIKPAFANNSVVR